MRCALERLPDPKSWYVEQVATRNCRVSIDDDGDLWERFLHGDHPQTDAMEAVEKAQLPGEVGLYPGVRDWRDDKVGSPQRRPNQRVLLLRSQRPQLGSGVAQPTSAPDGSVETLRCTRLLRRSSVATYVAINASHVTAGTTAGLPVRVRACEHFLLMPQPRFWSGVSPARSSAASRSRSRTFQAAPVRSGRILRRSTQLAGVAPAVSDSETPIATRFAARSTVAWALPVLMVSASGSARRSMSRSNDVSASKSVQLIVDAMLAARGATDIGMSSRKLLPRRRRPRHVRNALGARRIPA